MMDYNSMSQGMMGGNIGMTMFFMWLTYVLIITLIILGIIALFKYISKN